MTNPKVLLLKLLISFLIILNLLKILDLNSLITVLKNISLPIYFFAMVNIFFATFVVNTFKWKYILKKFSISEKFSRLFRLNLFSNLFTVFSLGQLTGEIAKSYRFTRNKKDKSIYLITIFLDRLSGLLILGLFVTIYFFSPLRNQEISKLVFLLFSISIFTIFLLLKKETWITLLGKLRFALGSRAKRFTFLPKLQKSFERISDFEFLWLNIILISFIFHLIATFSIWLIGMALGVNLDFFQLIWIYAFVSILLLVPITIGGLGLRESGFIFFLGLLGIKAEVAVSLSILLFASQFFFAIIGGLVELTNKNSD
ncbi:hypothetical protein A2164_01560 [Candidatus Curtissbacteria bacterium RBG_13_35_7]|uniref:Flippase-like domain-containing protein n=1 Tax=Candidatus Curtissbacteria bacterium RBG_13_35_7 TaxID=1797705 RepID=A0A1F5G2S8_9BACT|nr:MAG: hypothetical protein A2164_01560 [Candidatus Curtissbacteria bacterium RBG_13_35_7]